MRQRIESAIRKTKEQKIANQRSKKKKEFFKKIGLV